MFFKVIIERLPNDYKKQIKHHSFNAQQNLSFCDSGGPDCTELKGIWVKSHCEMSVFTRVTLYAEFLPMKSRATCILLIEVSCTIIPLIYDLPRKHSRQIGVLYNLVFVFQVFWAVGTVFEVLLAILVMPTLGWRWLLGLSTIPLFIFAILCFVSMILGLSCLVLHIAT